MLNPKLICQSNGRIYWFECPFCFELFEADKNKIKGQTSYGTTNSCGCKRVGQAYKPSKEEQAAIHWLRKEVMGENENLPPILAKLSMARSIALEWNTDANCEAANNFLKHIAPRPTNAELGWKDPLGPISPDNFEWKLKDADQSRTLRTPN